MPDDGGFSTTAIAAGQLRALIERVERLEEEKKEIADQVKEVYAEAKAYGFDVGTMRTVVKLRKMSAAERQEAEALLDLYMHALGMQLELPLTERPRDQLRRELEGLVPNEGDTVEITSGGNSVRLSRKGGKVTGEVEGATEPA